MGAKVFVGNLTRRTTGSGLLELFAAYGPVKWAEVVSDPGTGACIGFGFVQMESDTHASLAIAELHGRPFHGRLLRVGEAAAHHGGRGGRQGRSPRPRRG